MNQDVLRANMGALFAWALAIGAVVVFWPAEYVMYKVGWYPELIQYVLKKNLSAGQVIVESMPHDCEWSKAPLGNKYCHYQAIWYPAADGNVWVSWAKLTD